VFPLWSASLSLYFEGPLPFPAVMIDLWPGSGSRRAVGQYLGTQWEKKWKPGAQSPDPLPSVNRIDTRTFAGSPRHRPEIRPTTG
jgi:hypothetical protein